MTSNSWHKIYRRGRRDALVAAMGGKCIQCGSVEKLEFDHIDRKLKTFSIGTLWWKPKAELLAELEKCQLLCKTCHIEKTRMELGQFKHGTFSTYNRRRCRCLECKTFWNAYKREWRARG